MCWQKTISEQTCWSFQSEELNKGDHLLLDEKKVHVRESLGGGGWGGVLLFISADEPIGGAMILFDLWSCVYESSKCLFKTQTIRTNKSLETQ